MTAGSLYPQLIATKAWRLYPFIALLVTAVALLAPHMPTLLTDDFASRRLGYRIRCGEVEGPRASEAAVACRDAHSQVAVWAGCASFASNAVVALVAVPWLGRLSDSYGRRPFLALSVLCALGVIVVVLAHLHLGLALTWYYAAQVLANGAGILALCLAYLGDLLPRAHRGTAFGLLLGAVSGGLVLGAAVGAAVAPSVAAGAAAAAVLACLAYVWLALVESLGSQAPGHHHGATVIPPTIRQSPPVDLAGTVTILTRSELFVRLTLCIMLIGATQEGIQDLLAQYLQLKLGFGVADQGNLLVIVGIGMLLVQGLLLQPLRTLLRDRGVLLLGLAIHLIYQAAIGVAATKAQALTAVAFATLGSVTFPVISGLKSCHAGPDEQGAVQGALLGARGVAAGVGPLFFSGLFALFSRAESPALYFPAAPFVLGAVFMVAALCVAWGVPDSIPELLRTEALEDSCTAAACRPARDAGTAERGDLLAHLQQPDN